jgi:hypothetical protein
MEMKNVTVPMTDRKIKVETQSCGTFSILFSVSLMRTKETTKWMIARKKQISQMLIDPEAGSTFRISLLCIFTMVQQMRETFTSRKILSIEVSFALVFGSSGASSNFSFSSFSVIS